MTIFFVTGEWGSRSMVIKGANMRRKNYKNMKQTLTVIAVIALGAFSFAQAQPSGGPHGGRYMNPLWEMTSSLNLTDAQKAKAVIYASITQIRPLLTPEQQTKLDGIVKAHEDMHNAMQELHEAKGK